MTHELARREDERLAAAFAPFQTPGLDEAKHRTITIPPPINLEAEQAVLGAVLGSPAVYARCAFLRPWDFADPANTAIWEAIQEVAGRGQRISAAAVVQRLAVETANQADLRGYIASLVAAVVTFAGADEYARMVRDCADRRRILNAIEETAALIADTASAESASDVAAQAISMLTTAVTAKDDFEDAGAVAARVHRAAGKPPAVHSTGIGKWDYAMGGKVDEHGWNVGGGLMPGKVYGVAARQKAGKTQLLGTLSYNLTVGYDCDVFAVDRVRPDPVPHLFLGLEMSSDEIMQRMIARFLRRSSMDFVDPDAHGSAKFHAQLYEAAEFLKAQKLFFRTRPRMTLDDLKATLARAALSGRVRGVILDYLQLVGGQKRGQSPVEHLDNVAQTIVEAAKSYGLWIVVAAQLNQTGGVRGGEGLLNACDQVYYLHRSEQKDAQGNVTGYNPEAWLEMRATRFTPIREVGNKDKPALTLDTAIGPYFRELA